MNKSIIVVALAILFPLHVFAAQQPLQTRANTTSPSVDTNFTRQQLMNTEIYTTKADKAQVVRYWADHADGTTLAVGTLVAYNGKLYSTTQAFLKTSGATPVGFSAYFEPIAGATYTLPAATANTLGGVKVGERLTMSDGVLSADVQTGTGAVDSVNGKTGTVVLTPDDMVDTSTTNKFVTDTEKTTWNAKQNALVAGTDYLTPAGVGASLTFTATGFNGNLATTVNTLQELSDAVDDLEIGAGTDDQTAAEVPITDSGGYYTATDVEGALAERGADPFIAWDTSTITEQVGVPNARTNTIGVKANTFQAYDANMILWPSTISATEVQYLDGLGGALTTLLGAKLDDSQLDDTKGNGDTGYIWSADKVFDQLALKRSVTDERKEIGWLIKDSDMVTAVADGKQAAVIPASMNGMVLVDFTCSISDLNSAASGNTTIVLRRVQGATAVDMTSTGVTIAYTDYTASDEVIDTANDDVATGDKIFVDINGVTSPVQKGLGCTAVFAHP